MNLADLKHFTDRRWDEDLVPRLVEYVKVPAKSPGFDASWAAHGHLQAVVKEAHAWAAAQKIKGLNLEIVALEGKTPCIFFDVPATGTFGNAKTVLFYGHLDKQPEMVGWREGLGPWKPVVEDGKLYGRGSADDGYAIYAALTIVAALDAQGTPRPRCVGIIETCEESGSPDLPAYLDLLAPRFGDVALVAGLDSGCGNYEQLWVTTSLRGLVGGTMTLQQAQKAGEILGDQVWKEFPWVGCNHGPAVEDAAHAHAMPTTTDPVEGILARTWRPALSVTGAAGFPSVDAAGNVLRPKTTFKLSLRLPPTVDGERATATMKKLLTENVPYNAKVTFDADWGATGWNAPATAPWLKQAAHAASRAVYGKDAAWMGEGGTIPFMNMLGEKFPRAQFLITGVLGPHSNAHGPNEFLHIPYVKQLTAAVAGIVTAVPG